MSATRECFVPRPGSIFAFCDFDTLEMRTFAQVCLDLPQIGFSDVAVALRAGLDPHVELAAECLRISSEKARALHEAGDPEIANARQFCFHPDTEALTREGWVRIGDLVPGQEVSAAIPENGGVRLEWQTPLALTRRVDANELVHLHCEGIDLRVTPNHRMLGFRTNGKHYETLPEDLPKARYWCNAGVAQGGGWEPNELLLRLAVVTQADGSLSKGHQINFGFTKQRKIDRMRELLRGIPHRESISSQGVTLFVVFGQNDYAPGKHTETGPADQIKALLTDKRFDARWLNLSQRGRQIVLEEAEHWDSTKRGRSVAYTYLSMHKENAEILQIIATLEGRKTRLVQEKSSGIWKLTVRQTDRSRGDLVSTSRLPYSGDVVCLSVPSSFVVVRDGGIPVVVGQSKIGNYGLAGGMGAPAFVGYAKGYGIILTLQQAQDIHTAYRKRWRETVPYFRYCSDLCGDGEAAQIIFPRSGFRRGHVKYTSVCNGWFQHLAAMGAKAALYQVQRESWIDSTSSLFGCRPWLFNHDEIGLEIPYLSPERRHLAAKRLETVMIEKMSDWVPDVPIGATVILANRWLKGAKSCFVDGLIVPSRPKKDANGKTIWVPDTV